MLSATMQILQLFSHSSLRNFSYLLIHSKEHWAFCLDPFDDQAILHQLKTLGLKLKAIINTHEHWDHTQGNAGLKRVTGCEIWAHVNAQGKIASVDRYLQAGERLKLDDEHELQVLDTPGHTFAHLCLLLVKQNRPLAVFTGDTLFNAGVGNCHNGGDPEVLYQTIAGQFQHLADEVKVYPGHEYLGNNLGFTLSREPGNQVAQAWLDRYRLINPDQQFFITTMSDERQINTFLRLDQASVRDPLAMDKAANDKQVFLALRSLRNKW